MATPKAAAPVVGFNHNVKYGPRVYHVQTEDSGLPHAHYITHLFVGGNIVSSMKSSYAEKAGERDLARVVRGLMEHQHKAMLRRLVGGEFDELAERLSAPHYAPGVLADGTNTASYVNTGAAAAPAKAKKAPAIKPVARPAPVPPAPKAAPPAAHPAEHPAEDGAHGRSRRPSRRGEAGRGADLLQREPVGDAQRRPAHPLRRGADQREEPRRGDPRLPFRGPRAAQIGP